MAGRISVYLLKPAPERRRPFWTLEWVDPDSGRRKSRSTKTADFVTADAARADLEYELNNGIWDGSGKIGLANFLRLYQAEYMVHRRPASQYQVQRTFAIFNQFFTVDQLSDVSTALVSQFGQRLKAGGYAAETIAGHFNVLKAALNWAKRRGLLRQPPYFEMPKLSRKRKIRRLDEEEFARLLSACPSDSFRLSLYVIWHTGLRRCECLELRWHRQDEAPWLDLEQERLVLPSASNKGDEDTWLPLHKDLLARLKGVRKKEGRVFRFAAHGSTFSRIFSEVAARAGLKCTLHDLRRTFGCRYAALVPAQILQRLMRHANIQLTMTYYVEVDSALGGAINLI